MLSRPESSTGDSWHGGCHCCQVSTVIQSSAGGRRLKAEDQIDLFYEHKAVSFFFWKNLINFHWFMIYLAFNNT